MSTKKTPNRPSSRQKAPKSTPKKRLAVIPIVLILLIPLLVAGGVSAGAMQFENRELLLRLLPYRTGKRLCPARVRLCANRSGQLSRHQEHPLHRLPLGKGLPGPDCGPAPGRQGPGSFCQQTLCPTGTFNPTDQRHPLPEMPFRSDQQTRFQQPFPCLPGSMAGAGSECRWMCGLPRIAYHHRRRYDCISQSRGYPPGLQQLSCIRRMKHTDSKTQAAIGRFATQSQLLIPSMASYLWGGGTWTEQRAQEKVIASVLNAIAIQILPPTAAQISRTAGAEFCLRPIRAHL